MSTSDRFIGGDELEGGVQAAEYAAEDYRVPTDVLVAMRPFGHKKITAPGSPPFDAVDAYVIVIRDRGEYADLGMRDCSWQFVIRELDKSTNESPWVVGTITHKGRAYFLVPPTADDMKRAQRAITALVEERRRNPLRIEDAEETIAEAFGDEEPF
jgi:hypothetical protein